MTNPDAAKLLGQAIQEVAVKTGGCEAGVDLSGPQLTMLVHDLGGAYLDLQNKVKPLEVLESLAAKMSVTTKVERFYDALTALCGGVSPEIRLCEDWFFEDAERSHRELQEWTMNNTTVGWAMGIGVIDAALTLANNPVEGEDHEF